MAASSKIRAFNHRLRRRCGVTPMIVDIDAETLKILLAKGWIEDADIKDKYLLAQKLGAALDELVMQKYFVTS